VGYLPQAITHGTRRSVSDLLGITAARAALHAIEAGGTGEDLYLAIGDDWDIEERARAWLDRLGLAHLDLDGQVERLSGGETIGVALAALFLRRPDILLLDEPTNNLDPASREEILAALAGFRGAIVLVTHDEGAVDALSPQRVIVLPEGTEDTWSADFADLVALA
jgi:ATPase subunit of ABC transporter with duplicated ATPase domains